MHTLKRQISHKKILSTFPYRMLYWGRHYSVPISPNSTLSTIWKAVAMNLFWVGVFPLLFLPFFPSIFPRLSLPREAASSNPARGFVSAVSFCKRVWTAARPQTHFYVFRTYETYRSIAVKQNLKIEIICDIFKFLFGDVLTP